MLLVSARDRASEIYGIAINWQKSVSSALPWNLPSGGDDNFTCECDDDCDDNYDDADKQDQTV